MTDVAVTLLVDSLCSMRGRALWCVDEATSLQDLFQLTPTDDLVAVSNRVDVTHLLQTQGFRVQCNDFVFSEWEDGYFDIVAFRVGKEKAQVHHWLNAAARLLRTGGQLIVTGFKGDGAKTYIDKAAQMLGGSVQKLRGQRGVLGAVIRQKDDATPAVLLDDKAYGELRLVDDDATLTFWSKPGVFGWQKVDQGSQLLVSVLNEEVAAGLLKPSRVIDLGCGYGYLCIQANRLFKAQFIATDNNCASIRACAANFRHYNIDGEVILADCACGINTSVDLLLCNPPFHQGFSVDSDLTGQFLRAAHRLLAKDGCALFVVNSFIALERRANSWFTRIETRVNNGRFKVVALRK